MSGADGTAAPPARRRRGPQGWRRAGRVVSGVLLLLLGVVGLFVPVLQGVLLLVAGVAVLAPVFPPARRVLVAVHRRWPRLRRATRRRERYA